MSPAELFVAGFEYVLRDYAAGLTWEESLDLASTPADRRPQPFLDGARAACDALGGWLDDARRKAKARGVAELEVDRLIARTRIEK